MKTRTDLRWPIVSALLTAAVFVGWRALSPRHQTDTPAIKTAATNASAIKTNAISRAHAADQTARQIREFATNWQRTAETDRAALLAERVALLNAVDVRRWLETLERLKFLDDAFCTDLRRALVLALADFDIARAARHASRHVRGADRSTQLVALAQRWLHIDPLRTAVWLRSLDDPFVVNALAREIVPVLAALDRAAAGNFLATLPTGQTQTDLVDGLVTEWISADFDEALGWARSLEPGTVQQRALVHLSYTWEQKDPSAALAFAQGLPVGHAQLFDLLARRIAARNPDQAAQWFGALPAGERRERALSLLLATWAAEAPEVVASAMSLLTDAEKQQQAAATVLAAWAAKSPRDAAQWAMTFSAPHVRQYALENVAWQWAKSDLANALSWIQTLPPGTELDAAIHAAAGALIHTDPETATKLALAIRDQQMRARQSDRAAKSWLARDRVAATAWLAASSEMHLKHRAQTGFGP